MFVDLIIPLFRSLPSGHKHSLQCNYNVQENLVMLVIYAYITYDIQGVFPHNCSTLLSCPVWWTSDEDT